MGGILKSFNKTIKRKIMQQASIEKANDLRHPDMLPKYK
jgi:hypothetical protein